MVINTCTFTFVEMKTLYQSSILEREGADYLESGIHVRSLPIFILNTRGTYYV